MLMNYLRFRAGDVVTPQLIGRRLTSLVRPQGGVATPVLLRAGDQTADKDTILAQRRPVDPTLTLQSLRTEAKMLHDALSLQAELDQAKWCRLGSNVILMRGEVTVNLFRLTMDGLDFRFSDLPMLVDQISKPQEWGKPVRQVSIELVREFLARLNGLTGRQFRLPTNDEYQRACYGQIDGGKALLGDLWTPCTTEKKNEIIWRMANGIASPPNESFETCRGIRLAETIAA